ncbi:hypothetical protein BD770DRAFT_414403 [Pilaira anomala]|nr:hypothetical protein BD770DRAFT_414403 [Pilaira anomala]
MSAYLSEERQVQKDVDFIMFNSIYLHTKSLSLNNMITAQAITTLQYSLYLRRPFNLVFILNCLTKTDQVIESVEGAFGWRSGKRKRGNDLFFNDKRRKVVPSSSSSRSPPALPPPASPTPSSYVACLPPPTLTRQAAFFNEDDADDYEDFFNTNTKNEEDWVVNIFTSAAGYPGATAIHQLEQALEVELKKAADAVLSTVSNLIPQITGTLGAIEVKKPQFDAILLAPTIVKNDIKNLDTQTRTLNTCLIDKTLLDPPSYLQTANSYASQINAAFVSVKSKYGVV